MAPVRRGGDRPPGLTYGVIAKEGTWNSFVPREALQTIQMDIAHMPEKVFGKSEFKYALFAIDVFSKKLSVIPLKRQTSEVTANALEQIFEEDLGLPIGVYNDEGGEFMAEFAKRLKYYDVEQTTSRTPPAFVERATGLRACPESRSSCHGHTPGSGYAGSQSEATAVRNPAVSSRCRARRAGRHRHCSVSQSLRPR